MLSVCQKNAVREGLASCWILCCAQVEWAFRVWRSFRISLHYFRGFLPGFLNQSTPNPKSIHHFFFLLTSCQVYLLIFSLILGPFDPAGRPGRFREESGRGAGVPSDAHAGGPGRTGESGTGLQSPVIPSPMKQHLNETMVQDFPQWDHFGGVEY